MSSPSTPPTATGRLRAALSASTTSIEAVCVTVMLQQQRTASVFDRLRQSAGAVAEHRAAASFQEQRAEVMARLHAGQLDELSARQARIGARMVGDLSPEQMNVFLRERPETDGAFVEELFRSWDALAQRSDFDAFLRLGLSKNHDAGFLRRLDPATLRVDGPKQVASRCPRGSLDGVLRWLDEQDLPVRWNFGSQVLAIVVSWMMTERGADAVWRELAARTDAAVHVLPLPRSNGRWFFSPVPQHTGGSTVARASLIAYLLGAAAKGGLSLPESLVAGLIDSEFGDPRLPPESAGWQAVKSREPAGYAMFLETLIREDLTLFFQYAMDDVTRQRFWLRYLKAIRRTICVFASETYQSVKTQLAGANTDIRAAIDRVRRFRHSTTISAFCLYFDNIVVIEFSHKGNAAYIYHRSDFDRVIEPALRAGRVDDETDLKLKNLRIDSIRHASGWEWRADHQLAQFGVSK